jgi:hypothetical protein
MKLGQKVKLKENSIFAMEIDKHNPTDKIGVIVEIGNEYQNPKRTQALPVLVDWGKFTNSYRYLDLEEVNE